MDQNVLAAELENIISAFLLDKGLDLIELVCQRQGRDLLLRVITDKPQGGINLGECSQLNRELGNLFEERDIIQEHYLLEVASPGLDRPLKVKKDFLRCLNKPARFFLTQTLNGKIELEGKILGVIEEAVEVETSGGSAKIPLLIINRAKQVI